MILRSVLLAAAFVCVAPVCLAQSFPDKPVRFVIGFTPGGPSDILARALGQKLAERWGQQVVIENRPGAGGNSRPKRWRRARPTATPGSSATTASSPPTRPCTGKLPYDPVKDFAPVALVAVQPNILVVHPAVPANSVMELVSLRKEESRKAELRVLRRRRGGAPGGRAVQDDGRRRHRARPLQGRAAGADRPDRGAGAAHVRDLRVGHSLYEGGRLRALAVTTAQRSPSVPELPTVSEAGLAGLRGDDLARRGGSGGHAGGAGRS